MILATRSYIGEGFDDARLDTLLLAMAVSWKGTHSNMRVGFTGCTTTSATSRLTTAPMGKCECSKAQRGHNLGTVGHLNEETAERECAK